MIVTYKSSSYRPEQVTGRYIKYRGGQFHVFETITCQDKTSMFYGRPGMGFTIREYRTEGLEVPEHIKKQAKDAQMQTVLSIEWPL